MKDLTYLDFANRTDHHVNDVLWNGEILRVSHPNGKVVVMHEDEYRVMHEALEMVLKDMK